MHPTGCSRDLRNAPSQRVAGVGRELSDPSQINENEVGLMLTIDSEPAVRFFAFTSQANADRFQNDFGLSMWIGAGTFSFTFKTFTKGDSTAVHSLDLAALRLKT